MAARSWISKTERSPNRLRLVLYDWQIPGLLGLAGLISSLSATAGWVPDMPFNAILLGLGGFCAGLCLTLANRTSVVLDKEIGVLHIHKTGLFKKQTQSTLLARLTKPETRQRHYGSLTMEDLTLCFDQQEDWIIRTNELWGASAPVACKEIARWMQFFLRDSTEQDGGSPLT